MTMMVAPASSSRSKTPTRVPTSSGCSPVEGSSKTYSTPRWLLRRGGAIRSRSGPPPRGPPAGRGRRGPAEPQVAQPPLVHGPQRPGDRRLLREPAQGVVDGQAENIEDGEPVDADAEGRVVEPGAVTGRALDVDVGQVLHVQVDAAEAPAGRALALAGVEREVPGLPLPAPGGRRAGVQAADGVEGPRVGGRR